MKIIEFNFSCFGVFSLIFFYATLFILSTNWFAINFQPQFNSMMPELFGVLKVFFYIFLKNIRLKVWIIIILVPCGTVSLDLIYIFWRKKIDLSPEDIVLHQQKKP